MQPLICKNVCLHLPPCADEMFKGEIFVNSPSKLVINIQSKIFNKVDPLEGDNHQLLTMYVFVFHLDTMITCVDEVFRIRNPCKIKTINSFNPRSPWRGHPLGFSAVTFTKLTLTIIILMYYKLWQTVFHLVDPEGVATHF